MYFSLLPALAILLLLFAMAMLVAEIFIPSGGLIAILSIVSVVASVWCAWKAWWVPNPMYWWIYLGSVVVLLPSVVSGSLYALPRTSFGRRILLEAPSLEEVTPYAEEEIRLSQLIGRVGETLSLLNPGGMLLINEERIHCESEGMMIDAGLEVEIVSTNSNRLVVRLRTQEAESNHNIQGEQSTSADTHSRGNAGEEDQPPLDFELPQS